SDRYFVELHPPSTTIVWPLMKLPPGERACAVIVPTPGASPDVASLLALLVSKGVAKFKAPEQVVLWDALPKNDAGKVLKHRIRAALSKDG
ncbi:AMP-binding enzyme, partial [Mycobacterium avium]